MEKVLIKEEAKHPITKNVNYIFVIQEKDEKDLVNNKAIIESIVEPSKSEEEEPPKKAFVTNKVERRVDDEPTKSVRENVTKNDEEEAAGASNSHTGAVYEAILKKMITKKEDIRGNFEIPCNIGVLKHINALVDQGSDVNVMPFSTYSKLTNERPTETDIRLSLVSYSYIYPLGIAEDVLVDVAGYVYPVDFVILDIKEDEKGPFILGTSFLTTAKAIDAVILGRDVEKLEDVLFNLETSYGELSWSWYAAAKKEEQGTMVGYQGVVDKVSAFYTKNLTQPWQTMFKVFNHCLTTRTSGHDQTKINILQMFHAVINQTNIEYAALLWWDFINKLIIDNLMKKFQKIPQRIEEDYHFIKDDIPLVSEYTTGDVRVQGMLILNAFLTEEIHATDDFKESTPRAHRTPTLTASPQGKKRKQSAGESTEAQENIAKVQEKLAEEEIEKMVEGDEDEESYAKPGSHEENPEKVDDDVIEIEKEKKYDIEIDKEKKDDVEIEKENKDEEIEKEKNNDNVEETDKVVKEKDIVDDVTGSMEIRKEQKQTLIPSPTRSPRNVSSFDKTVYKELTATVSPTIAITSKDSTITKHKKNLSHIKQRFYHVVLLECADDAV
ncbi:ribonuclease H-like domain-containing protein [Tanacetum coccineum]|uniref:Ribonuclease H-like domain-containing protein n=1 Tax=Tanacetum coccineum TaxID=301880 RepID=A0ABQ4Z2I8_9ASTR